MDSQAICVRPNIGPGGVRMRLIVGIVGVLVSVALTFFLVTTPGLERWFRLFVFAPLYFGIMCLLQAREKT